MKAVANRKGQPGIAYIIGPAATLSGEVAYKVGVATTMKTRLRDNQIGCPDQLEVAIEVFVENALAVEKTLLAMFEDKQYRGSWYTLTAADLEVAEMYIRSRASRPY